MMSYKDKYKTQSNRLKGFDYTSSNWYYITICIKNKKKYFGEVVNGEVKFNLLGKKVKENWFEIPKHFDFVTLDEFIIMPNHLHGIIILNNDSRDVQLNVSTEKDNYFSKISPHKKSLSVVIRTFKSSFKTWCNKNNFNAFAWQANYYDHIIRNETDLYRIRKYIILNPLKWEMDKLYI